MTTNFKRIDMIF